MRKLALFLLAAPAFAATEWVEVSSPNFQLYTTSGSGDGRRTVEYFEQVRDFFMRAQSKELTTRLPVYIILFRNQKEFRPYAPGEGIAAFFTGDQSRDFIVMSGADEKDKPVAVHEYMHLLIRHMDLKLPIWLNEGIAEVYSTLKPLGGKIVIGSVPAGAGNVLSSDKWLPLERLFAIQRDSPEYNEKNRRGILYAQSWMLTHMLMLSDVYQQKFGAFLGAVSSGVPAADALLKIYGRTAEQVNRDLNGYFRANLLKGVLFDAKLQKIPASEPKPADDFDVELALARLAAVTSGKQSDAVARLERLTAQQPDRWESWEALAQVAWRRNDRVAAAKYFKRAVDLKPPVWNVYWDYAKVADPNDSEAVIGALKRSLELNGNNTDARLLLGYQLYMAERFKEAVTVYKTIPSIDGDRAPQLFLGIAHAAARAGDWTEAESAVAQAKKYAKTPSDVNGANLLADYLERRKSAAAAPDQPVLAPTPAVQEATAAAARPAVSENVWKIRGLLRQVDCMDAQARLRIMAGSRTITLVIADPDQIVLTNKPGTSMTLTCGAQPEGTDVTVEYVPKKDEKAGTEGEVRGIEFGGK